MKGRGRGEPSESSALDDSSERPPVLAIGSSSSDSDDSSSGSNGESSVVIRGRGAYRLNTCPANIKVTCVEKLPAEGTACQLLTNFVEIVPMAGKEIFQYRFEFEPLIESVILRRQLVRQHCNSLFDDKLTFDGVNDGRSSKQLQDNVTIKSIDNPTPNHSRIKVTIRKVGKIEFGSFELLRLYNMKMRDFLRELNFFQVQRGQYVHQDLKTDIPNTQLSIFRGYNTAANVHKNGQILMNMEAVHKIIQQRDVAQIMDDIGRNNRGNPMEAVRASLVNKLVVTKYNNRCYKIEDVNFDQRSSHTFERNGNQISYVDYFSSVYNITIRPNMPMLKVMPSGNKRSQEGGDQERVIYVPPELCLFAGLTNEQANDNRLKMELVRNTQLTPEQRIQNLNSFMSKLMRNENVKRMLNNWGYTYGNSAKTVPGHILPTEKVGWRRHVENPSLEMNRIDQSSASFETQLMREKIAVARQFKKMYILISNRELRNKRMILDSIKNGFDKVGLIVDKVEEIELPDDRPATYSRALRDCKDDASLILIIIPRQNKEIYDVIKRYATVDRGVPTQVVTGALMANDKKRGGASVKIALQIAAKIGSELWHVYLPLKDCMICGYDTYHDTTHRGRSFGAFIASTNSKFSRWYSKINSHEKLEELSTHLAEDLYDAILNWKKLNNKLPERIILFRDGVGDGQLEHVFEVELKQAKKALKKAAKDAPPIRLTMIIVNKRIGARFYHKTHQNKYDNPPPGTVVDKVVTRDGRYDFYLISQSTRQGTIAPTYYNVIFDECAFSPERLQMVCMKLTLAYYNWAGSVRVPAPCQYAHKLAFQTGESLHSLPNPRLNNLLHFL